MRHADRDVAIIGVGPVGAVLAGLLGSRGLRVVAIEKHTGIAPVPRAGHFDHTVLRTLQELGCLDEVLETSVSNKGLELVNGEGTLLARLRGDIQALSGLPASIHFHQPALESIVRNRLRSMPNVELALGVEMTGFTSSDDGVVVTTDGGSDSSEIHASFLVGCDGAASDVRRISGIEMEDLGFDETWLVVDLLVRGENTGLPANTVAVCGPKRPQYSIEMAEQRHRLEFMVLPGEEPDELQADGSLEELIAGWVDPSLVAIERKAVYQFHALLAETWRSGPVFLAGDAAHQTPPFLGQGLCTGIRDAENLAWKLDHVINKGAAGELLDTYEIERKPRARHLVASAVDFGRLICEIDPDVAARRHADMIADERPPENRMMFRLGKFEEGPLVLAKGGGLFPQPVTAEERLDDLIGQRFFVLARTTGALGQAAAWWEDDMEALVLTLDQVPAHAAEPLRSWLDTRQADVVVVRPDRYVLGAGADLSSLTAALDRSLLAGEGAKHLD